MSRVYVKTITTAIQHSYPLPLSLPTGHFPTSSVFLRYRVQEVFYHKSSIGFGERLNVQTYQEHFPQNSSREEKERPRNAEDDCVDVSAVDSHAGDLRATAWVGGYARGSICAPRDSHTARITLWTNYLINQQLILEDSTKVYLELQRHVEPEMYASHFLSVHESSRVFIQRSFRNFRQFSFSVTETPLFHVNLFLLK